MHYSQVRDTSSEAYIDILQVGTVGKQAQQILDAMVDNKDYSLQELSRLTQIPINAISGRVNELKKRLCVIESDKRKCSITGRTIHPVIKV